jgi:hypothetical protein
MEIIIGKYYDNRTKKYLLPCLREYGDTFVKKFGTIIKLAVGIHDRLLDGSDKSKTNNIYILCDSKSYERNFDQFLSWIKFEPYYITDYKIDSELNSQSRKHMIVLLIPTKYQNAYLKFRQGKYSEMYTKQEIDLFFSDLTKLEVKKTLLRHSDIRSLHCERVNKEYNSNNKPEDFTDCELDFPISVYPEQEIFNYFLNLEKYDNRN